VMRQALANGVNYVDLGGLYHMTKRQLKLHRQFKEKDLVAVLGCGSTPGITNVLAEYGARRFDRISSLDIAFADKDYTQYEQPFVVPYSMQTVFDEFTKRPAMLLNGRIKFVKPLEDARHIEFPKPVGRVLCRPVLHSELASLPSVLRKKGIRECSFRGGWDPRFIEQTRFLIEMGFASEKQVMLGRKKVIPREISIALLNRFLPNPKTKVDDTEFLRVEIKGIARGRRKRLILYCQAFANKRHNIPAGSWDTGVPPSVVAQEIARGQVLGRGVITPEQCIRPALFFRALEKRGMKVLTRNG